MKLPFRQRLWACIHPLTYKYFLPPESVAEVWSRCAVEYGDASNHPVLPMIELDAERLLLRAPASGNPITVIRKRRCTGEDIARLHELLDFLPDEPDDPS